MKIFHSQRLGGASVAAILAALAAPGAALAQAATYNFDIPSQDLGAALRTFAREAHQQISFNGAAVSGKQSPALNGAYSADDALRQLLSGSGLNYRLTPSGVWVVGPSGAAGGANEAAVPSPAGESTATVEAVVVTGTNIRGGVTASPVISYDRTAIEQSGYIDTTSFLSAIPQNWAGATSPSSLISHPDIRSDAQPGENGANLHGLGARATLTLIDGHRMAPADFGAFTDVNAIPLTAIDHIDVLTDGSSALYGGDAVAGVVNFVLRKHMEGAETVADVGGVTKGGMRQDRFSQSFGLDWTGGAGIFAYDYNDETALRAYSRGFTPPANKTSDLTPRQFVRNLFAHATQTVNDRLDFYFTGLATHRSTSDTSLIFGSGHTGVDEVMALAGAHYQLNRRWDIDLSVDSSGYREHIIQLNGVKVTEDATGNTATTSGELLVNGRIFTLPAGDIKTAFGGELRRETSGLRVNTKGSGPPKRIARDVSALFAELDVPIFSSANARPLLQELTLTGAGRWEHYSDFGDTANPKFGIRWKPGHELLLRATDGTSFNAPTLREASLQGTTQTIVWPEADPTTGGITNALLVLGYAKHIGPEFARTKTIGGDYEPDWAKGLKLSATWFETRYANRIGTPPGLPFSALSNPLYASEILRNPTPAQVAATVAGTQYFSIGLPLSSVGAIVHGEDQNLSSEDIKGWDLGATFIHALGAGTLTLAFNGEHIDSFMVKLTAAVPATEVGDTAFNPAKWKTRTTASWTWREWTFGGSLNTIGSYTNNLVPPPYPRVKAYDTVDGQISYRFSTHMQPLSGLMASVSIIDLFDTQAPAVAGSPSGFDPTNASPLGRVWTVSLRKRW